jgi:hypothetical protein
LRGKHSRRRSRREEQKYLDEGRKELNKLEEERKREKSLGEGR